MREVDMRRYRMLQRVCVFATTRPKAFPPGSVGRRLFDEVRAAVAALTAHSDSEHSGRTEARIASGNKARARAELCTQLAMLSAAARAVAKGRRSVPAAFRLRRRLRDQDLVTAARAIEAQAAPNEQAFIAHHMPPNFLQNLRDGIERFEESMRTRAAATLQHTTARAEIRVTLASAVAAAEQLDVIVGDVLRRSPDGMAVWQRARRTQHRMGRPPKQKPSKRKRPALPSA